MSPIVRRRPDSPRPTLNHPQKRVRPLPRQPPSEKGQTPSSSSRCFDAGSGVGSRHGGRPLAFDEGGPMLQRLRPRSAYDLVALLALFIAVATGGAYAANTIGSGDVIDESLLSQDLKNGE